jgi:glycerol-3-phosphate dehydrogenase (NAD(P)+)
MQRIGVIGGGAWGTALAMVLRRAGRDVTLWAHEPEVVDSIIRTRRNPVFLPGIELDGAIRATDAPGEALAADLVLLAVPAQFLRAVCRRLAPLWPKGIPAVICAKGVETATGALMTEVAAAELPGATLAILSGPTFAIEVARGLPTAIALASADLALATRIANAIGSATFRPYATDDPTGVAIGGAVKNVLAVACGVVEGKGLGDNARAALITRGLAELARLVVAKGGRAETCMGLSGLGDLVLTASSAQSRNYSLGVALGRGRGVAESLAGRQSVTEGVATAPAVVELARRHGVEVPVSAAVAGLLRGDVTVDQTIDALLARPFKTEQGARG